MLLHLFIAVCAGKGLNSLLLFVMFNVVFFVIFPCDILGQMWNLIESFPDLCLLSYFDTVCNIRTHWVNFKVNHLYERELQYQTTIYRSILTEI